MSQDKGESVPFIPYRFQYEVALVARGAQGIGKAIATRLALERAHVVIADIERAMLTRTAREIATQGGRAPALVCDISKRMQMEQTVAKTLQWHSKINVLMHVAVIADSVPFLKSDEKLWDRHMDINLKGAYLVAHAVLPSMVKRRSGRLVFMAFTNCWDAKAELAHYNASKAGVFLLAKTLAREFGPYGIRSIARITTRRTSGENWPAVRRALTGSLDRVVKNAFSIAFRPSGGCCCHKICRR